jgi:hypothetical protein
VKPELHVARLLLDHLERAGVEDADLACAVSLAERAGERSVLEAVVLHVDREVRLALPARHAFRHGPRDEHLLLPAEHLETEVPVQPRRVVLVDHKSGAGLGPARIDVSHAV